MAIAHKHKHAHKHNRFHQLPARLKAATLTTTTKTPRSSLSLESSGGVVVQVACLGSCSATMTTPAEEESAAVQVDERSSFERFARKQILLALH